MGSKKKNDDIVETTELRPMATIEARENRAIEMAFTAAEKQLQQGTASSQVITHFLKLATIKEQLEKERLEEENKLLRAKTKALESAERSEELYKQAIDAIKLYSGQKSRPEVEDDPYDY